MATSLGLLHSEGYHLLQMPRDGRIGRFAMERRTFHFGKSDGGSAESKAQGSDPPRRVHGFLIQGMADLNAWC